MLVPRKRRARSARVAACLALASFLPLGIACSDDLDGRLKPRPRADAGRDARSDGDVSPIDGGEDDDGGVDTPNVPCTPTTCNGHGLCVDTPAGADCKCDDGFGGNGCVSKTAEYGRRVKIADDLADPDVLKIDDDHFVVSGTGGPDFGFHESSDLVHWTKTKSYNPSQKDPDADYCFLWAPDIVKDGGKLYFYFSAHRGPKGGTTCPAPSGYDYATYRAVSEDGSLDFGKPEPLFPGTTGARTYAPSGCPSQGCSRAIRIDPTLYEGRLYYVFFGSGANNIASVSMTNTSDIRVHAGLAGNYPMNGFEEKINEGPELFERDGRRYMFFSAAFHNSQYATFYVMADKVEDLNRDRPLQRLTTPVRRRNGNLLETHGHNSIATRRGEAFNFYHMGVFNDQGGLVRRDTWSQRLTFNADGTAMSQNEVRVSWNGLGGGNAYSLDVVLHDKSVVGPCIGAGIIGQSTQTTYVGVCPDAPGGGDRLIHRADIAAFRLYASPASDFRQVGEVPYDGYSDTVTIDAKLP